MDQNQTRQREREAAPGDRYELLLRERQEFLDRGRNGSVVVRQAEREMELYRQGWARFYLHPVLFEDAALSHWAVFVHDIRRQSGKHRHQGGLALYVLEGMGATEVNGELVEWEEGDLILLPFDPEGIEHVHFNRGSGRCQWLALVYLPFFDHVASELTQTQDFVEYAAKAK